MEASALLLAAIVTFAKIIGNWYLCIPFEKDLTRPLRWQILRDTLLFSCVFFPLFLYLFSTYPEDTVPLYKSTLMLGWLPYWYCVLRAIPGRFVEHVFTLSFIACWMFTLNTVASLLCSALVPGFQEHTLSDIVLYCWLGSVWTGLLLVTIPAARSLFRGLLDHDVHEILQTPLRWGLAIIPLFFILAFFLPMMSENAIYTLQERIARLSLALLFLFYYRYISHTAAIYKEKLTNARQAQLLSREAGALHDYASLIEESNEKIRILHHDMHHHISMLRALLESGNTEEARKLLQTQEDLLDTTRLTTYSDYPLINAVLSIYIGQAKANHIAFSQVLNLPENMKTNCENIATLLANLMENAIHASLNQPKEARQIELQLQCRKDKFVLMVSNRFDGELKLGEDGLPLPSGRPGHGIGLVSLRAFLRDYHATCTYEKEDGFVRVLLYWKDGTPAP